MSCFDSSPILPPYVQSIKFVTSSDHDRDAPESGRGARWSHVSVADSGSCHDGPIEPCDVIVESALCRRDTVRPKLLSVCGGPDRIQSVKGSTVLS
jgi:hypothetical protein